MADYSYADALESDTLTDAILENGPTASGLTSRRPEEGDTVIAVMGITGVGKSSFISLLSDDKAIMIGHNLQSSTHAVSYHAFNLAGQTVWLMDTPGFDDSFASDEEVFKMLAFAFADLYERKVRLARVLYLHRILDIRFTGSARRSLEILKLMCGEDALLSITFVSTFWSMVEPEVGAAREKQLISTFWADFLKLGARVVRHSGDTASAQRIVDLMLKDGQQPTLLAIQREIIDKRVPLSETASANYLIAEQAAIRQRYEKQIEDMKKEYVEALQEQDSYASNEIREEMEHFANTLARLTKSREGLENSWTDQKLEEENRQLPKRWR